MSVWLITTGSSDVQVTDREEWGDWLEEIRSSLSAYGLTASQFPATRSDETDGVPYRVASRLLGLVYAQMGEQIFSNLEFPLLREFVHQIQGDEVERIVLLVSDQEQVFGEDDRFLPHCPYWQDTCGLFPILQHYLQGVFPQAEIESVVLAPESADLGLDHWDAVLNLVQRELKGLGIDADSVYVSHQAGTPAISSAVPFTSLAQFGQRVSFLVSSEYQADRTVILASSRYLRSLKIQEAIALLERYDYEGVQSLLGGYLNPKNPVDKRLKQLLEAAVEWNRAEFQKFKNKLVKHHLFPVESFPWWRSGYESAYLAYVRFEQGNLIEALFHSFRAVEGSVKSLAQDQFGLYIENHPKYGLQFKQSIKTKLPGYPKLLSPADREKLDKSQLGVFGVPLWSFLQAAREDWRKTPEVAVMWKEAKEVRNSYFHSIEGMQPQELFQAWDTQNLADWLHQLVTCLNFISNQDFDDLAGASLMARVHREIQGAIDALD
jgi:hypothetical protein